VINGVNELIKLNENSVWEAKDYTKFGKTFTTLIYDIIEFFSPIDRKRKLREKARKVQAKTLK
jgi:hypothetical protein